MDFTEVLSKIFLNIGHIAVACLSVTVLLGAFNYGKLSPPLRRLFYFLIFNLGIEISARIFVFLIPGSNNLPLLHIYTLGEFLLLSWFYKDLIEKPAIFRNNYYLFISGISFLIVVNSLFIQSIFEFNTVAKTMVQIILISYAVLYFFNRNVGQSLSHQNEKELGLINSAMLLYYSGTLFIFMGSQISFDIEEPYLIFWTFNAFLNFVFQLLILIGIWKAVFRKVHSSY